MAALSDDDVPTMASVDDLRRGVARDGDTATASEPPSSDADEEDRTVQQVAPQTRASSPDHTAAVAEPPVTPVTPKRTSDPGKGPLPPAPRKAPPPSSRKMTAVGLGAPPPATRLSAQADLPKSSPPEPIEHIDDENDITATAPAPKISVPKLPISRQGDVAIRTIEEEDEGDETEVRTIPGNIPQLGTEPEATPAKTPITPAAGAPPPPSKPPSAAVDTARDPADEPDDSITTQAPAPNVPADTPPIDDGVGVIRISSKSIMPAPEPMPSTNPVARPEPATKPGVATEGDYFDDDEESITTKGPSVVEGNYSMQNAGADYVDDSVTTQAPITRAPGMKDLPPAIEDGTEGTTQKVRKNKVAATTKQSPVMPAPLPADEEGESITAQAPAQMSNMLRVVAGPQPVEDDDDPFNRTAVMADAPVRPPPNTPRANGAPRTAAAPRLEPSSESGLRVAREATGSGERASLGALTAEPRPSGIAKRHDPSPFAKTEMGFNPPIPGPQPSLHEVDFRASRPRYGLLVGIVAAFSVGIPLILFLALNQSGGDTATRVVAQPTPDPVPRVDSARARWNKKAPKPPPDPTPSATPSTSATTKKK